MGRPKEEESYLGASLFSLPTLNIHPGGGSKEEGGEKEGGSTRTRRPSGFPPTWRAP